jgi:hypothetical protein
MGVWGLDPNSLLLDRQIQQLAADLAIPRELLCSTETACSL